MIVFLVPLVKAVSYIFFASTTLPATPLELVEIVVIKFLVFSLVIFIFNMDIVVWILMVCF